MQVQCPGCNKTLNAPDSLAGRVVKCLGCGGQMQLPEAEAQPLEEFAGEPAPDKNSPPPAAPRPAARPPVRPGAVRPGSARRTAATGKAGDKKCRFCGESILATATKCRHCKSNLSGGAAKSMGRFRAREANSNGNKALILGILSLFCAFGFIMAPLAIIYGNSARKAGDGKGTAGMIIGIISSLIWVLGIIAGIMMAGMSGD